MSEREAGARLQTATDGGTGSTPDGMRSSPWARALSVTGHWLIEAGSTPARGLEGRSLAMYFSLMLPERSRLRL
jgi:hypothetical protein